MNVLGVSFGYHDASATLVQDGEVVVSAAEERFTGQKHDPNFPVFSIQYCLESAGIQMQDLDKVVYHENPARKFSRVLATGFAGFPFSRKEFVASMSVWLRDKLWSIDKISKSLNLHHEQISYLNHHFSHATQAFMGSGYDRACILVVDAVGDWSTTSFYKGEWINGKPHIEKIMNMEFPHSLGLVYSAFTSYLGFSPNDSECSTMALAGFGKPNYAEQIRKYIFKENNGFLNVDQSFFNFIQYYKGATTSKFHKIFGEPRSTREKLEYSSLRSLEEQILNTDSESKRFADIAASIQKVFEEKLLKFANSLYEQFPCQNLAYAGGGAMNCVANYRLLTDGPFKNIYIPADPGDGGTSIGTALYSYYKETSSSQEQPGKKIPKIDSAYWGLKHCESETLTILDKIFPSEFKEHSITALQVKDQLQSHSRYQQQVFYEEEKLWEKISELVFAGKIVGLFQNRFEIGPRALGNSIQPILIILSSERVK